MIDRLAQDLKTAFPELKGFSARNLKYMRKFADVWPEPEFVQEVLAQLPWYHQIALMDKLKTTEERRWYATRKTGQPMILENGKRKRAADES